VERRDVRLLNIAEARHPGIGMRDPYQLDNAIHGATAAQRARRATWPSVDT
jgi:hypothetical protein